MMNRRSRILLSQRRFQNQKEAHGLRSSWVRVLTRKTNLKTRLAKPSLLSLVKFLETAKGLQLLQEIERKNADNAGDDVEELDSSDSDNDQHFRQNARQRRLRKQRRTRLRILLDEMSEQGHLQRNAGQVSGGNAFSALERQDESTTGTVRIGCRAPQWMRRRAQSMARRTGGRRSSLFPSRIRQGRQQVHSEVSQMPQGLEKTVPVVFTKTAHVASVVCHGRGDDQAWTPLAIDHGVVIGRVLLTPLGGSEPHRSKPASSSNQCSPTLGRALVPAGEQTTVQSWGRGRHSGGRLFQFM